jgi:hypothetical protein
MAIAVLVSVVYKPQAYKSLAEPSNHFYVTLWRPAEIKSLADWLKNSPYRESPILMTRIQGKSAYLSLYFPEIGSRRYIIKYTVKDSDIQRFLKSRRPSLLITCDDDDLVQARLENLLGTKFGEDMLIHTENYIKVYDIKAVVDSRQF